MKWQFVKLFGILAQETTFNIMQNIIQDRKISFKSCVIKQVVEIKKERVTEMLMS